MSLSLFILAVENSGDQLGAKLISSLKSQNGSLNITGIGGAAMKAKGAMIDFDISRLAILGITEALSVYIHVKERVKSVCDIIMKQNPDAVILIDSYGFMIRVAKGLKQLGYQGRIVKYVAPQVWASRSGRVKTLAANVDYLLSIQPMDKPYFDNVRLKNDYVGNPIFDEDYTIGDGVALRKRYNMPKGAPLIGVFFGSRLSELSRLAKPFADAVEIIAQARPDAYFVSPMAESIAEDVLARAGSDFRLQDIILLGEEDKKNIFRSIDVAMACSGTLTTQLATAGVPTIVAYKLSKITYFIGKYIYKPEYISIVNLSLIHI